MDLYKAIRELMEEKQRIDRIIASLEAMLESGATFGQARAMREPKRRGRKGMSAEERREVSERMARYWAAKRAAKSKNDAPAPQPDSQDSEPVIS